MFLLLYAIVLAIFWLRAVYWVTPKHYPGVPEEAVFNFRKKLLDQYKAYAAFFIIAYFIAFLNGSLAGYFQRHQELKLMHLSLVIFTGISIIFDLGVLIFIILNCVKNLKISAGLNNFIKQ